MQDTDYIDERIPDESESDHIHKLERTRKLIHGRELDALRGEIASIHQTIAELQSSNESLEAELESARLELVSVRSELQRTVEYEKDFLIQSITERDIKYEQELAGLIDQLGSFQNLIDTIQNDLTQLSRAKTDLRTLGIKYSKLAVSIIQRQKLQKDL